MRTMYDAVSAANIPDSATMVAGYADTIHIPQWSDADWARFPKAVKVRIVKKAATTGDGHVLDVETGDATPAQAPGWVLARRREGADPTVYCNASTWAEVISAFTAAKVALPNFWIAEYDGVATLPTHGAVTAVAKQFKNGPLFDTSIVADYWPGVDQEETMTDPGKLPDTDTGGGTRWHDELNADQLLNSTVFGLKALGAKLDALTSAVAELKTSGTATPPEVGTFPVTGQLTIGAPQPPAE